MRTFSIVIGAILVCALFGVAGFWLGDGGFVRHDVIMASMTGDGDLEITALQNRNISIERVRFNDTCTLSRFKWYDRSRPWLNGGWVVSETSRGDSVILSEGDVAYALYWPQHCGARIVKAEVFSDAGTYVFRYPSRARTAVRQDRFPMKLEHGFDLR